MKINAERSVWGSPVLFAALALAIGGCATTVRLGQTALRQGRYIEAASNFESALKDHPKRTDAQLYLGLAHLERGDSDSAAEHLRAFRDLSLDARVNSQVDDALHLIRTQRTLSSQARHFVATSLEFARKSEQALQDARSTYATGPYDGDNDPLLGRWTW